MKDYRIDKERRQFYFSESGKDYCYDGNSMMLVEMKEKIESAIDINIPLEWSTEEYSLITLILNMINSCGSGHDRGACKYCYANQGNYDSPGNIMSLHTARAVSDIASDVIQKSNGNRWQISYFGGESFLVFDNIANITKYTTQLAKEKDLQVRYLVTTNGILLDEDKVSFMKDYDFAIALSLDGGTREENSGRVFASGENMFDKVTERIHLLDGFFVNIRITNWEENWAIHHNIRSLRELGFNRISHDIDCNMSDIKFGFYMDSLKQAFDDYYYSIKDGKYYDFVACTQIIRSLIHREPRKATCNAGLGRLAVSSDGYWYICPRFIGIDKGRRGNVFKTDAGDIQKLISDFSDEIGDPVERNDECSKCPFVYLCGANTCYYHGYKHDGQLLDIVERECARRKLFFKETLGLLCKLTLHERKQFMTYLCNLWKQKISYPFVIN